MRAGRRGAGCARPVGPGGGFEFYSRGVKFSPAERTYRAALSHKESVLCVCVCGGGGGLKNVSPLLLETEPGRCHFLQSRLLRSCPPFLGKGAVPHGHWEQARQGTGSDLRARDKLKVGSCQRHEKGRLNREPSVLALVPTWDTAPPCAFQGNNMGENDLEKHPRKGGLPWGSCMLLAMPRLGLGQLQ